MLKKIKELCDENHITIKQLEAALGFGNGTISKWADSFPRVDKLKAVADYFDKPIEYFLKEGNGE